MKLLTKLSQSQLKEVLHYNSTTGVFTWLISNSNRVRVGDVAGTPDNSGYILISINRVRYRAHRLARLYMKGKFPSECIDHINHITGDNSWKNIRSVSMSGNAKNMMRSSRNSSGVTGVYYSKSKRKWVAQISINRKHTSLGSFTCKDDAVKARKKAEIKFNYHKNHGTIIGK